MTYNRRAVAEWRVWVSLFSVPAEFGHKITQA
jgi:hypothetical protein